MNNSRFRNNSLFALIFVACSVMFWGCAGTTSATPASQIATGTYANPTSQNGDELKLLDNGIYNMGSPKTLIPVQGTYVVKENQVVFTETKDGHCTDIAGTYKWSLDGKAITFAAVEDQCSIRRITLESGSWIKQP